MNLKHAAAFIAALSLLQTACFGLRSHIIVNDGGGGTINLEYFIDASLLEVGALDGNAARPTFPVGREDFARTVARIPGLTLKSFTSKEEGTDAVYLVSLEYQTLTALAAFFQTSGETVTLGRRDGRDVLTIVFAPAGQSYSPAVRRALPKIFAERRFEFVMNFPRSVYVRFLDGSGAETRAPYETALRMYDKMFAFWAMMPDLFTLPEGFTVELSW
ncbi:MAG: hypothetical protein LBS82_00480 [Spirochaetaceae bacterium]|jgi:hypothetical protein|nr:hypothetical protein [Spirochaetaceae bacterium]